MKIKNRAFKSVTTHKYKNCWHVIDNTNVDHKMMIMADKFEPRHKYLVCFFDYDPAAIVDGSMTESSDRMLDIFSNTQINLVPAWTRTSIVDKFKKYAKSVLKKIKRKFK